MYRTSNSVSDLCIVGWFSHPIMAGIILTVGWAALAIAIALIVNPDLF